MKNRLEIKGCAEEERTLREKKICGYWFQRERIIKSEKSWTSDQGDDST